VPALNIIAKRLNISDDVAGATLMAAGASAPELFSNIVSIFITHSALGMGTIVGSEIFNQLVICGGAIFAAKNNCLKLDPIILVRDISFYAISLVVLFWALSDRRAVDGEDIKYVYIAWYHGAALISCYLIYVLVCANFNKWFVPASEDKDDIQYSHYEAFETSVPSRQEPKNKELRLSKVSTLMPYVREPSENFHESINDEGFMLGGASKPADQLLQTTSSILTELYSLQEEPGSPEFGRGCIKSMNDKSSLFLLDNFAPTSAEINGIEDIERRDDCLSLYLWQRSSFYDKAKIDIHAWELRWFRFSFNKIDSLPRKGSMEEEGEEAHMMPLITSFDMDKDRLLIKVFTKAHRDYYFLAPTDEIFAVVTRRFEELLQIPMIEMQYSEEPSEIEYHESLVKYPSHGSFREKTFHIILFPIKVLINYGVPDVRTTSVAPLTKAVLAAFLSVIFLVFGSYVMVTTLDCLAHELELPESVVGATISAAGTSLPNYIASQMAARQGLGNMAISNVFGSNTFNILVALGVPWLLYTCLNGGYYSELPDEGIAESMLAMAVALFIFVVLVSLSKFQLHLWHAYYFFAFYLLFIVHYIGQCLV
jgi:K+-dependent Na+/Ca+ exchanger-like protein